MEWFRKRSEFSRVFCKDFDITLFLTKKKDDESKEWRQSSTLCIAPTACTETWSTWGMLRSWAWHEKKLTGRNEVELLLVTGEEKEVYADVMVSSMFDNWIVHQRFVILRVCFIWTKLYQLFHESTKKLQHNVCLKVTLAKGKLKKTWKNLPLTEQCICSKVVQTLRWCSFQNKIWNLLDCVSKSDPFRQFSVVILSRGLRRDVPLQLMHSFLSPLLCMGIFPVGINFLQRRRRRDDNVSFHALPANEVMFQFPITSL